MKGKEGRNRIIEEGRKEGRKERGNDMVSRKGLMNRKERGKINTDLN